MVVLAFSMPSFFADLLSRVCDPDNWRYKLDPPPPTGSFSMLEWKQIFLSLCTPCAGGCLRNINNKEVATVSQDVAKLGGYDIE